MRTLLIAAAALCLSSSVFGGEPAKAEEYRTVTVTGEADFNENTKNLATAKEKAREVAMRDAVNQVVGTFLTGVTEVKDYATVRDVVFSHSQGYVHKAEVVSEKVDTEAGTVTVTMKVEVGKGAIDRDAAAVKTLLAMKGQKRVYVAVDDNSIDTVGSKGAQTTAVIRHGVFDAALRDALRADGFTCLDPNIVDGKLKSKSAIQALSTAQEALEIAKVVGADVVIYGHVTSENSEGDLGGTKILQVHMRAALSVAATDSGESVGDVVDSAVEGDTVSYASAFNRVMKKGAAQVIPQIRSKLFDAWRAGASHVVMGVTGLKDFNAFAAFKELLRSQVRGVKDVYSGKYEKGSASIEVAVAGSVETLAGELQGKTFKGQTIQVTKATSNTLELALGK